MDCVKYAVVKASSSIPTDGNGKICLPGRPTFNVFRPLHLPSILIGLGNIAQLQGDLSSAIADDKIQSMAIQPAGRLRF